MPSPSSSAEIKTTRRIMNESSGVSRKPPEYKSHKVVFALRIAEIMPHPEGGATIVPAEEGYAPFHVDQDFVDRHKPLVGGYFVVYKDGWKSFSPAEAFETGYTRIESPVKGTFHNDNLAIQIERCFRYHTPKEGQPEIYTQIREKAKELANLINDVVPDGREKSSSITRLEET